MTIQATVMIPKCWHCNGSGAKSGVNTNVPYLTPDEKCERCKGSGHEPEKHWIECPDCGGTQGTEVGPFCPSCDKQATFTLHSGDFTETHGLDCGPYEHFHEEWLTCGECGEKTDDSELKQTCRLIVCNRCKGEGMIFVDADGEESEMEQARRRTPLREQEQRWREAEQLRDEKQLGELW